MTRKLILSATVGAGALLTGGCHAPWFARLDARQQRSTPTTAADRFHSASSSGELSASGEVSGAATAAGAAAAADDAALATVMEEVHQMGANDPAAQQRLLAELRRAKPEMWPLVVEQFRSSLAYHRQLVERQAGDTSPAAAVHDGNGSPNDARRPSATVGALVDPRGMRPDPAVEQAFATATPANMPPPLDQLAVASTPAENYGGPRPFRGDEAAEPLSSAAAQAALPERGARSTPRTDDPTGVRQAAFSAEAKSHASPEYDELIPSAESLPRDWMAHLDLAADDLGRRLADAPQSTAEVHQQVSFRLLELLAGRTEDALRPIPGVSAEEQDYWSGQIFALATFLDHHTQPDDKRRAATAVAHLDEAVAHLRELGALSLTNLSFAKNVYDYGVYDSYDEPKFLPGEQVSLYVEVENFHSESTEKGYCTSLGASYELVDEQDQRVDGRDFPNVEDCCLSRRRDFHIQYGLVLPKSLSPGKYRLRLLIKDRQSDKIGHSSVEFEIRGK